MLTKRELTRIRKALPKGGFDTIALSCNKSRASVIKILTDPKRYNKEVIYQALIEIEKFKEEIANQKAIIKSHKI
jgi:hypothetical protein